MGTQRHEHQRDRQQQTSSTRTMAAAGGWLDNLKPDFLKQRDGDFLPLQDSEKAFGPGPLLVLFQAPDEIDDAEIQDMLSDGAPAAARRGVALYRLAGTDDSVLDLSLQEALDQMMTTTDAKGGRGGGANRISPIATPTQLSNNNQEEVTVVLLFSGFNNPEMLATYNILGPEIYQETAGQCQVACAKVMPNALQKPLRQVLDEIAGDHSDAMQLEAQE